MPDVRGPVNRQTRVKYYLPATLLVGGKKINSGLPGSRQEKIPRFPCTLSFFPLFF